MAGQYRFKDQSGNIVAQISASAGGTISFSGSQVDFSNANTITLGEVQLAGTASNAMLLDGYDYTAFTFTSSIHPFTSSTSARLNSIETVSASNLNRLAALETTSASVDTLNTNQNTRLTSLENKTGSLASTGSNTFFGTQTFSGSVYIANDLVVQGSSSIQYITGSSVSIGTNIVNLNTANPSVRYAGLNMIDSGSIGGSGSFLYDSVQDEMIFVHRGSSTVVTSSVVLMGPQTYDNIGAETYPTNDRIQKGTGNEHLADSCIWETSGSIGINCSTPSYNLDVNGCTRINGSLTTNNINVLNGNQLRVYNTGNGDYGNLTFATATGFTSDKQIQANAKMFIQRASNGADTLLQFKNESGTDRAYIKFGGTNEELSFYAGSGTTQHFIINASGCVGINTSCPKDLLEVYGGTNNGINICASGQPRLGFFVGGASADNKIWDFIPQDNNTFIGRVVNDAKNSAASWISVTRNTANISSICFPQTNPIYIGGCLGIGVVPNGPGLRLASDTVLRVEGASSAVGADDYGISLGGRGSFRIDAPGVGAGRFIVNSCGCVGINASSPDTLLTMDTQIANFSTGILARLYASKGTAEGAYLQISATRHSTQNVRRVELYAYDGSSNSANLVLQPNSGCVGIGTYVPNTTLEVRGSGNTAINTTGNLFVASGGTATQAAGQGGQVSFGAWLNGDLSRPYPVAMIKGVSECSTTNYNYGALIFGTMDSNTTVQERMRINSSGNVGIGTTGNLGKLTVFDTGCTITSGNVTFATQAKGIEIYNACSGVTDNVIGLWFSTGPHKTGIASGRTNAASNWEVDLRFYVHPTDIANLDNAYERMRLYGGGNLTINGSLTQNGSLSDINLKDNILKISTPLQKISCINGYTFEWKEGAPARRDFSNIINDAGLIAQEVESVMPDIVRENECTKVLNYNGVIALLVEGMKEQQCTINLLKSCIGIN